MGRFRPMRAVQRRPAGWRSNRVRRGCGQDSGFAECGEAVRGNDIQKILGHLLCLLGFHDYRVISATFGFGGAGNVETVKCERCGHVTTRSG